MNNQKVKKSQKRDNNKKQPTASLFISYCHKDKIYRERLEKYLDMLCKNADAIFWSDQEILPGTNIDDEIKEKLKKSDIVLFLISQDFLSSSRCQKELDIALSEKKEIVPIIIRDCSWKDIKSLNKLKALPVDAKPIKDWSDQDKAWKNVYEELKLKINDVKHNRQPKIKEKFFKYISEDSIYQEKVEERFVYPDLSKIYKTSSSSSNMLNNDRINSKDLLDIQRNFSNNPYILIEGADQCGKTLLSKILFKKYFDSNMYPLLIKNISYFKKKNNFIEEEYKKIYENPYKCINSNKEKKILIIDASSENKQRKKFSNEFILFLRDHFSFIIIITNQSIINDFLEKKDSFSYFDRYCILPFGHEKRSELIEKNISLDEGKQFNISNPQHVKKLDEQTKFVNTIVYSNIIPSYPVFLYAILNSLKIVLPGFDVKQTTYGHCYQTLLIFLFQKVHIRPEDHEAYFNFLTQLSYWMFCNNSKNISDEQMDIFLEGYGEDYSFPYNQDQNTLKRRLIQANILKYENNLYGFRYIYIYYYFVAKYISENLGKDSIKNKVKKLIDNTHLKDDSNILIFILHHQKNLELIENIMSNADKVFSQYKEATLSGDEKEFIKGISSSVKTLSLPTTSKARETRKKELLHKDSVDQKNHDSEEDDDLNNELLNSIKKSMRTMEIIGQILRNNYGSLQKNQLKDLFVKAQNVGLRLLKSFMDIMKKEKDIFEKFIKHKLDTDSKLKKHTLSDEAKIRAAELLADLFSYQVVFGLIYKIVDSIGYERTVNIADEANNKMNTVASDLINIFIHTWYKKTLDISKLKNLVKKFEKEKNYQAINLLKRIIHRHVYMHDIPFKDKQKLSNLFSEFRIEDQLLVHKHKKN